MVKEKSSIPWQEFGIFPDAIEKRIDSARSKSRAKKSLAKLSAGNLLALCEVFEVAHNSADPDKLVGSLVDKIGVLELVCLKEFAVRRGKSISNVFEKLPRKDKAIGASVRDLAGRNDERIHKLSQLLVIYKHGAKRMRDVFYHSCWQARGTGARISVAGVAAKRLREELSKNLESLGNELQKLSDFGGKLLGFHEIPGGTLVAVYLRQYSPRVQRDYIEGFNLHHGCGTLVLGVPAGDGLLHVKSANREIIETVQQFVGKLFDAAAFRCDMEVCDDYDHGKFCSLAIDGDEPPNATIRITGIKYRRTRLNGVPLEIPENPHVPRIADAIRELAHAGVIKGLSILDIRSLTCQFNGHQIEIVVSTEISGSARLTYDNTRIDDAEQERFDSEFAKQFGVPLNRRLDPRALPLGNSSIIRSLLSTKLRSEVETFQTDVLDKLEEAGIIKISHTTFHCCPSNSCSRFQAPVESNEGGHCSVCGTEVTSRSHRLMEKDLNAVRNVLLSQTKSLSAWKPSPKESSFENFKFHTISRRSSIGAEDDRIVVVARERMTPGVEATLDRLGDPVLVLDTHDVDRRAWLERDGFAKFSVPFLLSTLIDRSVEKEVQKRLEQILDDLLRTHQERVLRAARISLARLKNCDEVIETGKQFETDSFNVARVIFPHIIKLGREGKPEPDGLIPIPDYRRLNEDKQASQFIVGYDAKLNLDGDGYDLSSSEQRKVKDYIEKYKRSNTRLGGMARRIAVHAFVSNHLTHEQMRKLVKYLFGEDGLRDAAKDIRCAIISIEFLIAMAEWFLQDPVECERRKPYVYEIIIDLLSRDVGEDRFTYFGEAEAKWIAEQKYSVIEDRVTAKDAIEAMDRHIPANLGLPPAKAG